MPKRPLIMIVEDDAGTMNLIRHIVVQAGYESVVARSGSEALELIQGNSVDLVLLDIMLRDVDGWTVLMSMKADSRFSSIPVFVVSARRPSEHPTEMEALAGLYDEYFLKPFEVGHLVAKIEQVLRPEGIIH